MVGVGEAPQKRGRGKDGLPKEMACRGIGVSQKQGMRLQRKSQAAWTRNLLLREKNQVTWRCAAKGWRGDRKAPSSPPQRRTPLLSEKSRYGRQDQQFGRAHLARHSTGGEKAAWGAHLRMRKVTGRDASLPAPWLATSFGAVARERVGALPPNPTRELRPLTPQGDSPLTPFGLPGFEHFSLTGSSSTL